ncbi:MAG: diaminopimelate epimerase [Bacteroidales bacterium]
MKIEFHKYQGTGNDFILIDNRTKCFKKDARVIRHLCDRNFGIGSDGIIFLEHSPEADFGMDFYNPDGTPAGMCGNGGRCIAGYAFSLGIIEKNTVFMAGDGLHEALILGRDKGMFTIRLKMKDPEIIRREKDFMVVDSGVPHYLLFQENIESSDLIAIARKIRYSPEYKKHGINIDLIEKQKHSIFVRSYERGIEGETLSCGTGVTASAIGAAPAYAFKSPIRVQTKGGILHVHYHHETSGFYNVWLEGNASEVFSGVISYE